MIDTTSTLVDLLRGRATAQPDQRAYTLLVNDTTTVTLTYQDLDLRARTIAAELQRLGAVGSRALLLYWPGADYIAGFLGCLYAGVIAVPAYPPNPARLARTLPRLQAIIANAGARFALTTRPILDIAEQVFEVAPDLGAMTWIASDTIDPVSAHTWQMPQLSGETLAFLQYTSGSTGLPKGVMLTHSNLLANLALISTAFGVREDDIAMSWLPPYHDMGLIGGILEPIYQGIPCVLMSPMDFLQRPARWIQAISHYGVTISGGPSFAYDLCAKRVRADQCVGLDLSRWRLAFNGAEPVRPDVLDRFSTAFAPYGFHAEASYPCYGLAEATLLVTGGDYQAAPTRCVVQAKDLEAHTVHLVTPDTPGAVTLVSCGSIRASQQIVVVNPDTRTRCAADEIGEIWMAGPSVAQGYWERPVESRETFQARIVESDDGPFLRTGDLGFLHNGELFVTGRLKDLIIIDGRNHYPQDIEITIEQCHPALRNGCSAAFSIEAEGQERLIVVAEIDRTQHQAVQSAGAAFVAALRKAVAEDHDLRLHDAVLLQHGTIPKTSSGKIQRHACKAGYLDGSLERLVG
ncbi:MAG: fatty acyl-AMP ligase [Oscillochloris sp.]|nr:fatty acyl-AMP ligase [Oscillochloris sp.]